MDPCITKTVFLRRIVQAVIIVFVAATLLTSCGPEPLDHRGTVNLWAPQEMPGVRAAADILDGLSLEVSIAGVSWLTRLSQQEAPPDLVYADWNRDAAEGFATGLLMDLTPYFDRIPPALTNQALVKTNPNFLLPAAVYTWGLFYNTEVLTSKDLQVPADWDEWLDTLEILKNDGTVPIALGASFGWPAVAWISYLDLRLNGGTKHFELLNGSRPFDDPSMAIVYTTLEQWRDKGYFNTDASRMNWPASLELIGSGEAAFVLMGAFGESRIVNKDHIAFTSVPTSGLKGERGELAVIEGFSVAKGAKDPEAALSLAVTYVEAGIPRETKNGYLMPVVAPGEKPAVGQEGVAAVQLEILTAADILIPQFDRYLPAQAVYDINRVLARFFDPNSNMSAEDLSRILKNIRP